MYACVIFSFMHQNKLVGESVKGAPKGRDSQYSNVID